jgi:hypothetical protein
MAGEQEDDFVECEVYECTYEYFTAQFPTLVLVVNNSLEYKLADLLKIVRACIVNKWVNH